MTLREVLIEQAKTRPGRPVIYYAILQKPSVPTDGYYVDPNGGFSSVESSRFDLKPFSNRSLDFFDTFELVEGLSGNMVPIVRKKL